MRRIAWDAATTQGMGRVITGWDQGCLNMVLGEIRQLKIPADEGYGASGFPAWGKPSTSRDLLACPPPSATENH